MSEAVTTRERMSMRVLVNFESFWPQLCADVRAARESVYLQTFSFEGDSVGQGLAVLLAASRALDRRVLADAFTKYVLSDKFRFAPRRWFDREVRAEARATRVMITELESRGVGVRFTNPVRLTKPNFLRRDHKKIIVVDDRVAYVGGINFSEHNAAWHDLMLRSEDPAAARFLRDDFLSTWKGERRAARGDFDGLTLVSLDGHTNAQAFDEVLRLIDAARAEIFVESPYLSFPFFDRLSAAQRRGVRVAVVMPERNNWGFVGRYAARAAARAGIDLHLYRGQMTHLKALLVDRRCLVLGSSNFDYLSYRLHQELLAFITAPAVIADFEQRVMLPDLENSRAVADTRAPGSALSSKMV